MAEIVQAKLAAKLAAIMATVKAMPKDGTHPQFKFVSVAQILEDLRPKMAAAGIIMLPRVTSAEYADAGQTQGGAMKTACHLLVDWVITDGTDTFTITTAGEGLDNSDKAANKAMTAALKQALSKLFLVSADEDPDSEHVEREAPYVRREDRQLAPPQSRPPAKRDHGTCPTHNVPYFQSAKMRAAAHPIQGGGWCNKPTGADQASYDTEAERGQDAEELPWSGPEPKR